MSVALAIRQGRAAGKVEPTTLARRVYHQLLPDFPGPAIQWVLSTHWEGPTEVPLEKIDTSQRGEWVATREPEKVKLHQKFIEQGTSKPIILGLIPGHEKLTILDAHHRFLAYEALARPPVAYVGVLRPDDVEAALAAHGYQYSGQSRLDGPDEGKAPQQPTAA